MREVTANLLKTSLIVTVVGIILTSKDIVLIAIIPLLFLLVPYGVRVRSVKASFDNPKYVGNPFSVSIILECTGFGVVKAMHVLTDGFELLEGNNVSTSFVLGKRTVNISYKAKPLRCGFHSLRKVFLEKEHPLMISRSFENVEVDIEFEIKPRLRKISRVETVRTKTKTPIPDVDVSVIGPPGTEFKEIREYSNDPMKFVNWKATARLGRLMVNRYEVEGKKTIWIMVDANGYMQPFLDYALELANSLTYYFCSRGHKVGVYVNGRLLYPDVGKRQFRRVMDELSRVDVGNENLNSAIEKVRKYLLLYKPFVIVITRVEYSKPNVKEFIKMGLKYLVLTLKRDYDDELVDTIYRIVRGYERRRVKAVEIDVDEPVHRIVARLVR